MNLAFQLFLKTLIYCVRVSVCVSVHMGHSICVEVRGQHCRTWFSSFTMWVPGWNSGHQVGGKHCYVLSYLAGLPTLSYIKVREDGFSFKMMNVCTWSGFWAMIVKSLREVLLYLWFAAVLQAFLTTKNQRQPRAVKEQSQPNHRVFMYRYTCVYGCMEVSFLRPWHFVLWQAGSLTCHASKAGWPERPRVRPVFFVFCVHLPPYLAFASTGSEDQTQVLMYVCKHVTDLIISTVLERGF